MNQKFITKYFLSQWASGIFFCSILYLILTKLKLGKIGELDLIFIGLLILFSLILYTQSNTYLNKSRFDLIFKLFLQWTLVLAACVAVLFFLKVSQYFSRIVLVKLYTLGFIAQVASYVLIKQLFRLNSIQPNGATYSIVEGKENFTEDFAKALLLKRNEYLIGYIDQDSAKVHLSVDGHKSKGEQYGGAMSLALLEEFRIQKIYLSGSERRFRNVLDSYYLYSKYPVDIVWHLAIEESMIDNSLILLDSFPFILLSATPNQSNPLFQVLKRLVDVLGSALLMIVLSPLFLLISALVRLSSKGPIFFKQRRHGLHGKEIMVYKFRSMYIHRADSLVQATKNDYRITPIGRFIRKTSIDELPQLYNVLRGSMSLVGPRPHPIEFNEYYGQSINEYMMRHRIKPGITGLAQVYGARGETDTLDKMLRRIKLDLEYINHQSMLMDLKILFLTPFALIFYLGH